MNETLTELDPRWGELLDVDVLDSSTWAGLFRTEDEFVVRTARRSFVAPRGVACPMIRCLDADRVIIVDPRTRPHVPNAWILGAGDDSNPFSAGDAIQDVLANGDTIVITYFDEGVLSTKSPAREGVAVFDDGGRFRGGYRSKLGAKAVEILDCYAACWVDGTRIAFLPYADFPLVTLDVKSFEQSVVSTPRTLHTAHAISADGDATFLFASNRAGASIVRRFRGGRVETLGEYEHQLRGLRGGRFIAHGAHGFTIVEP